MTRTIPFLFFAIVFLSACNSEKREPDNARQEIKQLELKLIDDSTSIMNQNIARKLIEAYNVYSNQYPTDSLAPDYLFKAGELAMNLNYSTQAIIYLNRFEKEFANHYKMPYCIFFQAFIYENQMNNLEKAEQYYQRFIDNYPEHELADDAATSIKNLGKPIEEIIKNFEKDNPIEL